MDAVAAAREAKDNDVPAVRVKANHWAPAKTATTAKAPCVQHAQTLCDCHRQSASMFAATGIPDVLYRTIFDTAA